MIRIKKVWLVDEYFNLVEISTTNLKRVVPIPKTDGKIRIRLVFICGTDLAITLSHNLTEKEKDNLLFLLKNFR